jgi:hypothetical protein
VAVVWRGPSLPRNARKSGTDRRAATLFLDSDSFLYKEIAMKSKTLLPLVGFVSLVALAACSANGPTSPDCSWDQDSNQSICSPSQGPLVVKE